MAVFTTVSQDEIARWLLDYDLGEVRALRGIASRIENSNFFLTMEQDGVTREYVLTIFERLTFAQLPYYLHLMDHLARHGISVPAPVAARDGEILRALKGKPATIVTRLSGASQLSPQASHCAEVGTMLARMRLAGAGLSAPAAQPARPGLVAPDRARDPAVPRPGPAPVAGRRGRPPDRVLRQRRLRRAGRRPVPLRPVPRPRPVRHRRQRRAGNSAVSSISTSPATTSGCSTWP